MAWWRRLFAEILPAWHRKRLIAPRRADEGSGSALERYRRTIATSDRVKNKRDAREKHDVAGAGGRSTRGIAKPSPPRTPAFPSTDAKGQVTPPATSKR